MSNLVIILQIHLRRSYEEKSFEAHRGGWDWSLQIIKSYMMTSCEKCTIFLFPSYDVSALFPVVCEDWVDKNLHEYLYPYGWSVKLIGALSTDFTYVMCGSRSLPMRMSLILKSTHEIGITHDHNVLALKAHVNNLIIICEQWYFISLK